MKRGSSGLSLVVAVNKPSGMTSHDVVNCCRRIFGERRVGHTGTLDPLATGVLPICVGPATRLDRYLVGHDKRYRVTMRFGFETTTDDGEGVPTVVGAVHDDLATGEFASEYISGLVGERAQVPPAYSAVKVAGRRAYDIARKGSRANLEPRMVEIYEARLVERAYDGGALHWIIDFSVSKGTYIRALVRDIGRELGCPAHVRALERRQVGVLSLEDCVSLESLESLEGDASVDPVRLLGFRFAFGDAMENKVASGNVLEARRLELCSVKSAPCSCVGMVEESSAAPVDGELVSIVVANRLKAVYRYDDAASLFRPDCVFSTAVAR